VDESPGPTQVGPLVFSVRISPQWISYSITTIDFTPRVEGCIIPS
jgi:hypothetical protein